MKIIFTFILVLNVVQLCSQNKLIIWRRELEDNYNSVLKFDTVIFNKDTSILKEIIPLYEASYSYKVGKTYISLDEVLLIYYGNKIKEPSKYKFPYNPLLNFIEIDKIKNTDFGNCIPLYDDLPDGFWVALKFTRDNGIVLSSIKEVENNRLNGLLKNYNSRGKLQKVEKYVDGYIRSRDIFNSNLSDSTEYIFDTCGNITSCKTYENGKLTAIKETGIFEYEIYFDDSGRIISLELENNNSNLYLEFEGTQLSERIVESDINLIYFRGEIHRRACNKYRKAHNISWDEILNKDKTEAEFIHFILSSNYAQEVITELKSIGIIIPKENILYPTEQKKIKY